MARGLIILLLVIVATLLVFDVCNRNVVAEEADGLNQVIENQKLILEKLQVMDKKLDVIRMRIKL